MDTVALIVLVVILLAALAAVFLVVSRNRRRAQLQERFGPEYDRAITETGNRREAEQHLSAVADKRDKLEIRDLDPRQRAQFIEQWELVQARFVDEPGAAVDGAELLITTVMVERGYPVDDFEERADLVSADHADVVEHYRAAHTSHQRHRDSGSGDTEDLRQAFVHYRALFDALIGRRDRDDAEPARDRIDDDVPVDTTPDYTPDTTPDTTPDSRLDAVPDTMPETRADEPLAEPDQVQRSDRTVDVTDRRPDTDPVDDPDPTKEARR
jgi:hypothetical protein